MKYSVGQVVYVVLNKKSQVYPMRIIEVINKKTLGGEATQYLLQAGSDESSSIMMDKLDGEVFVSAEDVQHTLIDRASTQIKKLVEAAVSKSREWYHDGKNSSRSTEFQSLLDKGSSVAHETDVAKVMLPDGTIASIKMPAA